MIMFVFAQACHYGALELAHEGIERHATAVRTLLMESDNIKSEQMGMVVMCCMTPLQYYFMGHGGKAVDLLEEYGVTYRNAESSLRVVEELGPFCRKLGDSGTSDHYFVCTEFFVWATRFGLLLCSDCAGISPADAFEQLPAAQQLSAWINVNPDKPFAAVFAPLHMMAALVCDMLTTMEPRLQERCDCAGLEFVRAATSDSVKIGGDLKPTSIILARMMEARFLARQRRTSEANAVSERAVARALQLELWLLAALVLRDMRGRARGVSQRGEYERRMCACLQDLGGEPALVSDILNQCFIFEDEPPGIDVERLLAAV
jgi:hypothetical protein